MKVRLPSREFLTLLAYLGDATRRGLAVAAYEFAGVAGLGRRRHHGGVGGLRSRSGLSIRRLRGCGCARPLWLLGGGSGRLRLLCGRWRRPLEVAAQFQARPAAGAVVPWEEPSAAAARWERPVSVAAAVRSMAPSAAEVAARLRGAPGGWGCCAVGGAVCGCGCCAVGGPPAAEVAAQLPAHPADAVAVPWAALFAVAAAGLLPAALCGGRTAAIVTPFLRGRGRRLPARLLRGRRGGLRRLLLGCRCLLRLLLRGRGLRWRAAAAFGRALLAALLRRRGGLARAPAVRRGLRLRTLSRRSRRSSGWRRLAWGGGVGFARAAARPEAVALLGAAPAAWASALQPAAVRACRAFRALQPALRRKAHQRRGRSRGRQRCNRQQRGAGQQQPTDVQADGQA